MIQHKFASIYGRRCCLFLLDNIILSKIKTGIVFKSKENETPYIGSVQITFEGPKMVLEWFKLYICCLKMVINYILSQNWLRHHHLIWFN